MRTLTRNKIRIFYANYRDKLPIKDEYGNLNGEYKISYTNPIAVWANVSAARGEATTQLFGDDVRYDRLIVLDDPHFPITETSILWIDTLPNIAEDGRTKTPHDYIVKRVAASLNSISIAVSKVSITAYPQDNDSFVDIRDDGAGNVSILSNRVTWVDDGAGNISLTVGDGVNTNA
jgi:hypothetical protein